MKPRRSTWALVLVLSSLTVAAGSGEGTSRRTWTFDAETVGTTPPGFRFGRTGSGTAGRWWVQAQKNAPSGGNVLAQLDTDGTDYRFPVAVAELPLVADLEVSVRCNMVSGKVDQACGLVWRYRDENNYYVARANALENNVRLYYVKDGNRKQLASWSGKVSSNAWHELRAEARGDHLQVYWNGKKVADVHEKTFKAPGGVGLWTKADSVTLFDDFSVEGL